MGLTYANIDIQNGEDLAVFKRGIIGEDEIRHINVHAMVDTGSIMLAINEEIQYALGLEVIDHRPSQLADGSRMKLPVVGPVVVRFADRFCTTNALVLPDDSEPLLGAIPMEEMDLFVHPGRNELAPVHPEGPVMSLK
ncbi:MAG: aspartyl protease family protein [Saprospiraceae bacterium]